jgi:hypothetical protein
MYTTNGKATIEKLWQETLDEFDFADIRGVLESMKKRWDDFCDWLRLFSFVDTLKKNGRLLDREN